MTASARIAASVCLLLIFGMFPPLYAQVDFPPESAISKQGFALEIASLSRIESLHGQYRRRAAGSSDQMLLVRNTAKVEYSAAPVEIGVELVDARQWLADRATPLSARQVSSADLLQLYARLDIPLRLTPGHHAQFTLGRQTIELGSRRLFGRSVFNVPISYTGITGTVTSHSAVQWQVLYVNPVESLPTDSAALLNNDSERDRMMRGTQVSGLYLALPGLPADTTLDLYYIKLNERDSRQLQTANRRIATLGSRLYREEQEREFDYEFEIMLQLGKSRASNAVSDIHDLDHRGQLLHANVGYSLGDKSATRVELMFDYVSGDKDPADGENNRFTGLYGARRFDFGPGALYAAFSRANIVTLGARLHRQVTEDVLLTVTLRDFELASAYDAWGSSGWRDSRGESGVALGQHLETRVQWDAIPDRLELDVGLVWLRNGKFQERVAQGVVPAHTRFAYFQTSIGF
jgi:hypothetical protein